MTLSITLYHRYFDDILPKSSEIDLENIFDSIYYDSNSIFVKKLKNIIKQSIVDRKEIMIDGGYFCGQTNGNDDASENNENVFFDSFRYHFLVSLYGNSDFGKIPLEDIYFNFYVVPQTERPLKIRRTE